jgi:hypothetical protein
MTRTTYTYNPACNCQWCAAGGTQPEHEGSTGHSWCYEHAHNPPTTIRFMGTTTAPPLKQAA